MADSGTIHPWPGWAVLAVLGLYAAGLLDNDITGLEEDRRYRPDRPLVTGAVSLRAARRARLVAWCVGLVASLGAGVSGTTLAIVLSLLILLYHRVTCFHAGWGPATLAACRGIALLMGAWSNRLPWEYFGWRTVTALAVWMGWVFLLSAIAHREEVEPARRHRVGSLLGALPLLQAMAIWTSPHPNAVYVASTLVVFAVAYGMLRRVILPS